MEKKKILNLVLIISFFTASLFRIASNVFAADPDGTPENPWQIATCQQLQNINTDLDASYILTSNIDCSDTVNWNGGQGFLPIGSSTDTPFIGSLNGRGYTIDGLSMSSSSEDPRGLFGVIGTGGSVSNISLIDESVSGSGFVGGLAGFNWGGTITGSYFTGSVTGNSTVGGLVGKNGGTITSSYSTGSVSGSDYVGGLAGYNSGTITSSYSTGSVTGNSIVGGLAGYNSGTITSSYSTGSVTGNSIVGGLVGKNEGNESNSYFDVATTGQSSDGTGGTAIGILTTDGIDGMKIKSTYTSWDFDNVWQIDTIGIINNGYPYLIWQVPLIPVASPVADDYYSAQQVSLSAPNSTIIVYSTSAIPTNCSSGTTYISPITVSSSEKLYVRACNATGDSSTGSFTYTILPPPFANGGEEGVTGLDDAHAFIIANCTQLQAISAGNGIFLDKHFKLTGLIDCSSYVGFTPIGNSDNPFTGSLDGNSQAVIDRLTVSSSGNNIGLFGYITGAVSNVSLTNENISGTDSDSSCIGGLVGYNDGGTITNSYSTGSVTGLSESYNIGGLVGYNNGGTITGSYSTSGVTGYADIGGLVGNNSGGTITGSYSTSGVTGYGEVSGLVGYNNGTITDSYSTGSVTGYEEVVGGLVGYNDGTINDGTITDSYSISSVTGLDGSYDIGGLVGYNNGGTISNSYSAGSVTGLDGSYDIGGLVGTNDGGGAIDNSYSTENVAGSLDGSYYIGGLVGYNDGGTIHGSYSTGSVTGNSFIGGLVGYNSGGTINSSYSTGSVTGLDGSYDIGGLVGTNDGGGAIDNSYSTGSVTGLDGSYDIGGLVGYNNGGTISNSYSAGSVTGLDGSYDIGGLVGYSEGGSESYSYFDKETAEQESDGGAGIDLSTTEMKTQIPDDTNWDFIGIWQIDPAENINQGYPYLIWQIVPATPVVDPIADTYTSAKQVSLSALNSTSIVYSTSAMPANCSSGTTYTGPITISSSESIYVRACTSNASSIASFVYTIFSSSSGGAGYYPYTPVAFPNPGAYTSSQQVTISSTNSNFILYSTSAMPADCSSGTTYTAPITVSSSETIYVRACDYSSHSATDSFTYAISLPPAPPVPPATPSIPVASLNPGTYTSSQQVSLFALNSTSIVYSTSAMPANCSSGTTYTGPITISSSETIYVRACNASNNSSTTNFTYTISTTPEPPKKETNKNVRLDQLIAMTVFGEHSDNVKELQRLLKDLGFFPQDTDITGYYGLATRQAVKQYQASLQTPNPNLNLGPIILSKPLNQMNRDELLKTLLSLIVTLMAQGKLSHL